MKTHRFLLFISLFLSVGLLGCASTAPIQTSAPAVTSIDAAVAEIADKAALQMKRQQPWRLGVMVLGPAQQTESENRFGEHFSENLTSALQAKNSTFRLFERRRLTEILNEHALQLSGAISDKEARRIGELAPLDVILTGTYSLVAGSVEINTRILDVVTGEIRFAHTSRIGLSPQMLQGFFPPSKPKEKDPRPIAEPQRPQTVEELCQEKWQLVERALNDLTTDQKVQDLVRLAIAIPFDLQCGRVHFKVIGQLSRHDLRSTTYSRFLTEALKTIEVPTNDDRAGSILRYLSNRGILDDEAWQASKSIIERTSPYYLNVYLGYGLAPRKPVEADMAVILRRIDEFFSLVNQNRVGRPVPASFDVAFMEMTGALSPFSFRTSGDTRALMHCYEKYHGGLSTQDKTEIFRLLKSMYLSEKQPDRKKKILVWTAEHFNSRPATETLGNEMFEFAELFTSKRLPEDQSVVQAHLPILLSACRAQYAKVLGLCKYPSQREDRAFFCIENDMACPGLVPTVDELKKQLLSEEYKDKSEAAKLLEKMGIKAKPAEAMILKMIRRAQHGQYSGASNLEGLGVAILGNIETANPEALELLTQGLGSLNYMVPDTSAKALVKIGTPALPYLIKALESDSGGVQVKAAKALGEMGPKARPVADRMRKVMKSTQNHWVRDALEDALERIQ